MTDEKKPEQEASDQPTQSTSQSASSDAPSSNKVDVVSTAPAAVKPAPKTAQPNKAEKNAAKLGWIAKLVIFLAFLLALAACLGVGYMLYQQHQELATKVEERQQQARESQAQANAISTMQAEMKTLTQQLKLERDAIKSANQNRELLQSRMSTLEKEIATVTGSHRIDWMLREVEHFINVAEQRLSLLGDARGALALMLEADDIVRAMSEPTARPLREALVKDIHELKLAAETSVDTDGIFLRISDLAKRVDQLGLPHYDMRQEAPVDTMSEDMPEDGLELLGARFVTFLDSLFRYQKHVKSKPMLLSAERDYLAQSIVLLLHQAQLALLRGDNTAYHLSLTEARERIGLYVRQQTKETQFFITEVTALGAIQLRPEVPTIEASSRAVRVFREFWNKEKLIREQETMALQRENAK